jgi:uncharacterized membrane protein YphA (DoxX/SURF4 family)
LLLVRAVFGLALLAQAVFYLRNPYATPSMWFVGLMTLVAGALLLMGFLTPVIGALVGLGGIGVGLSLLPAGTPNLFDSILLIAFAATMLLAIIILGPGGFSVDARMFGRREIIIPPPPDRHGS